MAMVNERHCVEDIDKHFSPNVDCDCPNECVRKTFEVEMTQSEWPTNKSIPRFINGVFEQLRTSAADFMVQVFEKYWNDKRVGSQDALNTIRSNFGQVNIHFKELSETIIKERPVYEVVNILSNIGGLLGLYLGFSVLTILEVVDFGFDFLEYLRIRGKKKMLQNNYAGVKTEKTTNRVEPQSERPPCYTSKLDSCAKNGKNESNESKSIDLISMRALVPNSHLASGREKTSEQSVERIDNVIHDVFQI